MKKLKQETMLKLTNSQLQSVINDHVLQENGLNEVFSMLLNGLMYSERQSFLVDSDLKNKGNGYRQATRSGIGSKLQLKIPRDRLGVFQPIILGLLNEQEEQIKNLCFDLYGKGLTTRQIEDVVENIYGTSLSKSSISRITTDLSSLVDSWLKRTLDTFYPIIYIDAIHLKVRRDTVSTEAFYVLLALKEDYTREVLSIVNIPQESALGWQEVLEDIKSRGVNQVGLFVFDGLTGLDNVVGKMFANSLKQNCVLHFQRNLSKHIRVSDRELFCAEIKQVFNPDDRHKTSLEGIQDLKQTLIKWSKTYHKLTSIALRDDLDCLFTYLNFDYRIRRMIYTTNWIERLNKSFRRTLKMRNALPNPKAAITLMGYVAMELHEKTYSYPITNFKFDDNFNNLNS
jgi:transposase-like protein